MNSFRCFNVVILLIFSTLLPNFGHASSEGNVEQDLRISEELKRDLRENERELIEEYEVARSNLINASREFLVWAKNNCLAINILNRENIMTYTNFNGRFDTLRFRVDDVVTKLNNEAAVRSYISINFSNLIEKIRDPSDSLSGDVRVAFISNQAAASLCVNKLD